MRLINICLLCFLVTMPYSSPSAAESGPDNTVLNYFIACQNGDIETIKQIITGPFYEKRKVLLNSNTEYSDFLARRFNGVKINLISVSISEENNSSDVIIEREYPQGSRLQSKFILMEDENRIWKIYDVKVVD